MQTQRNRGSTGAAGKPRVAVIGTGGTFAMQARHRFDWIEYGESGVVRSIDALMDEMGGLGNVADAVELVPVPFRALGSTAITPADWLALAKLIRLTAAADTGIAGFVVTHGTATLEETAWCLDLLLDLDVPVVITGAQRPLNTAGSDAPGNLRAALALAQSDAARGEGVLVVMNNQIFAARDVTKAASFELGAFEAPPFGALGRVEASGRVVMRRRRANTALRLPLDLEALDTLPRVDIVLSYAGADAVAIEAFVAAGSRAIVSAGLVPGRPAAAEQAALARAAQRGVVVVQSSRAPRGEVPLQAFLEAAGVLAGGDLAPQKLRIVLMLALSCTTDRLQIQRWIDEA
ncbi:asparaginase [Paraburkholderia sp. MMS20-SJTR3]|uniref:Asparaginase n=1 Tax=Paraburkholderia sejongensis TaxID=2886946 RepID=A0ABS8JSK5_9BURK|nr:asparaginase [Paraburkholderia sp. MMS20-SJTR3]MCC8392888.1 asparaginase [Paraburkholderia sp. MMS20-SJTR3]